MPRRARSVVGGMVYHVLNRANARAELFHKDADYAAFHRTLIEAHGRCPVRLLGWCVMPNHWHFVLWPEAEAQLRLFVGWLTHAHTQRYHAHYHTSGTGHVYQGRFKSFPVQSNEYLLTVMRYVERNPLRARLVRRSTDWPWGSAAVRSDTGDAGMHRLLLPDADWPAERRADWKEWIDQPQSSAEEAALRRSIIRGQPFGEEQWVATTAATLGLQSTLRPRGRPKKKSEGDSK